MEKVVSILSNHLAKKKELDIHIILIGIKRDIFYEIDDKITIYKPSFIFNNNLRLLSTFKTIFYLRKQIKILNPDSIICFGEYWNNLFLLATFSLKYPIYIADRSTPFKDLGKIQNLLRKILYPTATGLILQTEKAKRIYKKQFKNLNIAVVGNPIIIIENKNNLKKENIVLMVGRLIDTKHQDRLIRIFSKINKHDWKLVLVGDDAIKQKNKGNLIKLIKKLNMKDRVILAGKQKDVKKYFLKSKIKAFTSSSEGFPNVIGEAMAAEMPVVAYDCIAGPSELIVDSKNGFLIPLFNDNLFQNKLEVLMEDEALRQKMGNNAKKFVKNFDSNKISNLFLKTILKTN